jgi:hypothetical protein
VGETRVDLLHLLEDLRDAYPGSTEETILVEIVANALDSRATTITITTDPTAPALTIVDDATGMRRRELARYHDIASSAKVRGAGIGFAGVGIKIALLVCAEVITESRRGKHHVASTWRLASRHKAPWRWSTPLGLIGARGTAVRLIPTNALSPLLDPGFVEATLLRYYQPLFEAALAGALREHYPQGVVFILNGRRIGQSTPSAAETAPIEIRMARKRRPAGSGYLMRDAAPLPEDRRGVAISTFGKVIKRGWDWLGVTAGDADRLGGLIEVPALAECLTLNKADFIRSGRRGETYLTYRKAIQEAVSRQLAAWGQAAEADDRARRRALRPLERDLEAVLADLAEDFPLIAALVEQRAGGQRRLRVSEPAALQPSSSPLLVMEESAAPPTDGAPGARPRPTSTPGEPPAPTPSAPTPEPAVGRLAASAHSRRPATYALGIQFEERPEDLEIARLIEATVWVNASHPAYRRAVASRSEGYHIALAVAMALAPLAVDPAKEHVFITAFLARWGDALDRRRGSPRGKG